MQFILHFLLPFLGSAAAFQCSDFFFRQTVVFKGYIVINKFMEHVCRLIDVVNVIPYAADGLTGALDIVIGNAPCSSVRFGFAPTDTSSRISSLVREVSIIGANLRI